MYIIHDDTKEQRNRCVRGDQISHWLSSCYYVKGKCGIKQKVTINSNEKMDTKYYLITSITNV